MALERKLRPYVLQDSIQAMRPPYGKEIGRVAASNVDDVLACEETRDFRRAFGLPWQGGWIEYRQVARYSALTESSVEPHDVFCGIRACCRYKADPGW